MTELTRPLRRLLGRREGALDSNVSLALAPAAAADVAQADARSIAVEIAETDPLLAYLQTAPGPVEVAKLELDSPAVTALREAGVVLVVPLVSQGELIGTLNLGPRLSEQDYSTDDRRLLTTLAAQAAPAIRVAQLVREQAHEAAERERLEQEMRVATLIQQQFLPRELPNLPQWQIAAYYGPARAVGGDFYDFIEMPGGRIGIAVGDVTDKGVPAALVMARTHSILRAEASRSDSPGEILARANELLVPEMPARMFVTCLFAILDPATGHIVLANAGHFNDEFELGALEEQASSSREVRPFTREYAMPDGRRLYVLAEGRLVNLGAAEGHPAMVMDMSFADQALGLEWLHAHVAELEPRVYGIPDEIDREVARLKLLSMGIDIGEWTPEQRAYAGSWESGT